ncbi:hypothetical protein HAX54_044736 [Datura stramonium]|uniref:Uncharacterized protein n=1 Tax=Datura stramonium TaxID=4076 RepID=A0ABS8WH27_DATST|nr:hypothetical protein [Datura stramonium]
MVLKVHHILYTILCLSLCFLFFHEFYHFIFFKTNNRNINHFSTSKLPLLAQRKALATNFDFTPFVKNIHRHHKHNRKKSPVDTAEQPEPSGSEIDPRYGIEKRLVPSGPNPLHH